MMKRRNKVLAGLFAAGMVVWQVTPAQAMICTYVVNDPYWTGNALKVGENVEGAFDGQLSSTSALITNYMQIMVSATKAQASQVNIEGGRAATAIDRAQEAAAQARGAASVNNEILQAQREFGPESHIADNCDATAVLGDVVRALGGVSQSAKTLITPSVIPAAPGGGMMGREAVQKRLASHRLTYCSQYEVSAGLCSTVGSKPSVDVQAGTLFDASATDADAQAYINNLTGDPLDKPNQYESKTAAGVIRMATAMRAEAIRSPALASLAIMRAQASSGSGSGLVSQSNVTVNQALEEIMQMYGGGAKYREWDAKLSATDEYGVLRELVKLRALSMKLRNYQTESTTRIGAMISALLAGEAASQQSL